MIILSICSARPNFVKLAAVHHALHGHPKVRHVIVHTGQHYDPLLSDIFFAQLAIPQPDFNLGVKGGEREQVIEGTEKALLIILKQVKPDIVLVYGDVNGAFGAAKAAKQLGIKIGHVEAGLRSLDSSMPEELNRIGIDRLADALFITEESAERHLEQDPEVHGKIFFVGNTMIDTLLRMQPSIANANIPFDVPERFGVVTLHRPSNVDDVDTLRGLMRFFTEVARSMPLVFPMHPRFKQMLMKSELNVIGPNIQAVDPLGYLEFLSLLSRAQFILTDSGGIQEEAVLLKKRCFTLRRNTERPSTVESGSNFLIDPAIPADRTLVLDFAAHPVTPTIVVPPLWDGHAGDRIIDVLLGQ